MLKLLHHTYHALYSQHSERLIAWWYRFCCRSRWTLHVCRPPRLRVLLS